MLRWRLTIVVTAITWSGSVAWRMPRKNPSAIIERRLTITRFLYQGPRILKCILFSPPASDTSCLAGPGHCLTPSTAVFRLPATPRLGTVAGAESLRNARAERNYRERRLYPRDQKLGQGVQGLP